MEMNRTLPLTLQLVTLTVAVLAIANLVFLFLLPSSPAGRASAAPAAAQDAAAPSEETAPGDYTLSFDSDPLVYDGTGTLDLLDGVSLTGPEGALSTQSIFVQITAGETLAQKWVEYSAGTDGGQVTAVRGLELTGYAGPTLAVPEDLSELEDSELDGLLESLIEAGELSADDGFGNDITPAVTASYTRAEEDPYTARFVFTVTNQFGDTATAALDVSVTPRPILTLTVSEVTVERGASFNPLSYVAEAVDTDGSSLMRYIIIEGEVDTGAAGEYVLTYQARSPGGLSSNPVELRVTVS